jgi:hypothetical protein
MGRGDAVELLKSGSSANPPGMRLHAWCLCLRVAGDDQDLRSILDAQLDRYRNHRAPTNEGDPRDQRTMDLDLVRSQGIFGEMATTAELGEDDWRASLHPVRRVLLSILRLGDPQLRYYQGYDRFAWVLYLVSRQCTNKLRIDPNLAEAATWALIQPVLQRVNFRDLTKADAPQDSFYTRIDAFMRQSMPEISESLDAEGHSSFYFAMRWRMLWFTDEYRPREVSNLLLLWDQIFAHWDEGDYVLRLAMAHLGQIRERFLGEPHMLPAIQCFRQWNVDEIVQEAETLSPPPVSETGDVPLAAGSKSQLSFERSYPKEKGSHVHTGCLGKRARSYFCIMFIAMWFLIVRILDS